MRTPRSGLISKECSTDQHRTVPVGSVTHVVRMSLGAGIVLVLNGERRC